MVAEGWLEPQFNKRKMDGWMDEDNALNAGKWLLPAYMSISPAQQMNLEERKVQRNFEV